MATKIKLINKGLPDLKRLAVTHFHRFIRNRDKGKPCISCGNQTTLQAGHFYSAGQNPVVRFNEDNVHGQCLRCNFHLHGNLIPYQQNLIEKIGLERFEALGFKVNLSKQTGYKWDRYFLVEIIEKYRALNKKG